MNNNKSFEKFLNPERISQPDIDIDVPGKSFVDFWDNVPMPKREYLANMADTEIKGISLREIGFHKPERSIGFGSYGLADALDSSCNLMPLTRMWVEDYNKKHTIPDLPMPYVDRDFYPFGLGFRSAFDYDDNKLNPVDLKTSLLSVMEDILESVMTMDYSPRIVPTSNTSSPYSMVTVYPGIADLVITKVNPESFKWSVRRNLQTSDRRISCFELEEDFNTLKKGSGVGMNISNESQKPFYSDLFKKKQ